MKIKAGKILLLVLVLCVVGSVYMLTQKFLTSKTDAPITLSKELKQLESSEITKDVKPATLSTGIEEPEPNYVPATKSQELVKNKETVSAATPTVKKVRAASNRRKKSAEKLKRKTQPVRGRTKKPDIESIPGSTISQAPPPKMIARKSRAPSRHSPPESTTYRDKKPSARSSATTGLDAISRDKAQKNQLLHVSAESSILEGKQSSTVESLAAPSLSEFSTGKLSERATTVPGKTQESIPHRVSARAVWAKINQASPAKVVADPPLSEVNPSKTPAKATTFSDRTQKSQILHVSAESTVDKNQQTSRVKLPAATLARVSQKKSSSGSPMGVEVTTAAVDMGSIIYGITSFDSGLHVESNTDLQSIVVEPGKSFPISFRVTNMSGRPGRFTEEFDMPEGFELTFPPAEFSLNPMESFNSIVIVTAPQHLKKGEHSFTYNVFDPKDQSVRGSMSFSFKIMEMIDLKFVIEEKPNSIIDGEGFEIKGKLFNNSNATLNIGLGMTRQENFRVKVTPNKTTLAPGSFVDLQINGKTSVRNKSGNSFYTALIAKDLGRKDRRVLLKQVISIGFYTKARQRIDFKNRLPVIATIKMKSYKDEYSSQTELMGRGYLDGNKRRRIDFLVREKASNDSPGITMNKDEMRLKYDDRNLKVQLGDHRFGVANLSQSYRGRGLGIDYNLNKKTSFGMVDYTTRWSSIPLKGRGAYISHILNDRVNFKLSHFVTNSDKYDLSPEERFTTLAFTFKPDRDSMLKGEIAKKWGGDLADKRDMAFLIHYTTKVRNYAVFSVSHADTGVIYAGGLVGNENTTTSVNVPIAKGLTGAITYSSTKQSPLTASPNVSARKNNQLTSSLNYRLNDKTSFQFNITDRHSFDWLNKKYDERDRTFQAGISHNGRKFSSNYSIDKREVIDQLTGFQRWLTNQRIQGFLRMRDGLVISGFAGTSRNSGHSDYNADDSDSLGLSINWKLLDSLMAIMSYRETFYKGSDRSYLNLDLNLQYKFLNHSLEFKVAKNSDSYVSIDQPMYYELSLSREFGVPVGKSTRIGALTGVVNEILDGETKALGNITLLMGNMAAVTNSKGKFVFADLAPGTYTLDIDRRSGSINKVATTGLPAEVYIAGGKLAVLDLTLEDACQLTGEVRVATTKIPEGTTRLGQQSTDDLIAPMPSGFRKIQGETLAGMIIKILTDDKHYQATSDSSGRFIFYGLTPGKWSYRVLKSSIPKGYKIDRLNGDIEVTPGTVNSLIFNISPIIRKIEMVETN